MIIIPPLTITDAILDSSNIAENDNAEWNVATAYVVGNTVMVSTVEPDIHRNYECLVDSTGVEPWTDQEPAPVGTGGTNWLDLGATNRWKMFDDLAGSASTNADVIDVTITPGSIINSVALINVIGATAQVIVTDPVEGEVYNRTINLIADSGINDWYAYFFTPIERLTDVVFLDLPSYGAASVRVIVTETGSNVSVGGMIFGFQKSLGITDHGTGIRTKSFSVKDVDSFGNFIIVPRGFSKRSSYVVVMGTTTVADAQNFLNSIIDVPVVFIGQENFGSTIIFGYFRDFDIVLSGPTLSDMSLIVEGLT